MRIAYGFVAAVVCLTTAMFWASALGWQWNPWLLLLLCGAGALAGVRRRGATAPLSTASLVAITGFALLTAYAALTARETCADLLYFWGPKAVRFAAARGIDVAFLKAPDHFLMHPDYPPLVPLLYAWGALIAGGFSYWGPLLLTAILLAMTAVLVPGRGGVLMAALLAFGYAQALAAGAADPILILFEVAALCALTFLDDARLASIALAGAAMTKVEGAAFFVVVIVAYAIVSRRPLRAFAIAIAPAILLGTWIAFAKTHGLLDSYLRGSKALEWSSETLVMLLKTASYHAYYLPWLAVLAPLALAKRSEGSGRLVRSGAAEAALSRGRADETSAPLGRNWKRAALPLLVAAGSIAYILFFYMHADANRDLWIAVSAERVLLTPLAALAVAATASSE